MMTLIPRGLAELSLGKRKEVAHQEGYLPRDDGAVQRVKDLVDPVLTTKGEC